MEEAAEIAVGYAEALAEWLSTRSESALARAGALGRRALSAGLGVLDMVNLHQKQAAGLREAPRSPDAAPDATAAANLFLVEALTPFEMTHRGFKEISAAINRMVQFSSVVCHELRTPLTSLMNSMGMLAELLDAPSQAPIGRLMANINVSLDILKSRTDDLLDLAGFQAGTLMLRPGRVDVAALLAGLVERTPRRGDVELRLSVSDPLPPVTGDPSRLEQVVANLLDNALKYGIEGKRIDIRATCDQNSVYIEVQDYGAGIPLQERTRIWENNYRRRPRVREIQGLGIGLALCKELIRQHHGSITLESEEGRGSIFRIALPRRGSRGEGRAP